MLGLPAAAQQKLNLNTPSVPIAPASAKQPPDAVLDSTGIPGATDSSPEASPVAPQPRGSAIRTGSAVSMQLSGEVSSGTVKNGDSVHGTLALPVKTTAGTVLPVGTRVEGTVVSSARAGTVLSGGILSLQLTRVGAIAIVTDVLDFNGQEGHKDVADSAPEKGTEAIAQASATLQFHVLQNGPVPGVIRGARLPADQGGAPTSSGARNGQPSTGRPNTSPGVNQQPIHGGSKVPQTAAPATGPGR